MESPKIRVLPVLGINFKRRSGASVKAEIPTALASTSDSPSNFEYTVQQPAGRSPPSMPSSSDQDRSLAGNRTVGARSEHVPQFEDEWARKSVLSLDGGGIRGLSSLYILRSLMTEIRRIEEKNGAKCSVNSPLFRDNDDRELSRLDGVFLPCHYFDYIVGTSTGGIIAVMLGRLQFTVDEAIDSYIAIWRGMALHSTKYGRLPLMKGKYQNTRGLEAALLDMLKVRSKYLSGPSKMMEFNNELGSDARMCRTLVLAIQIDRRRGVSRPYLFRSYPFVEASATAFNRNIEDDTASLNITQVCRATSAAPLYFSSVKIERNSTTKFRDGSAWTVNPSLEAYREVNSMHKDVTRPICLLLSIGCGSSKRSRLNKILSTGTVVSPQIVREDIAIHKMMEKKQKEAEFEYCRLPGPDSFLEVDLNEWKSDAYGERTFEKIRLASENSCTKYSEEISKYARLLVSLRIRRAKTTRWEEFVFGSKYKCSLCEKEEKDSAPDPFDHRLDFMEHLRRHHDSPPATEQYMASFEHYLSENRITTDYFRPF